MIDFSEDYKKSFDESHVYMKCMFMLMRRRGKRETRSDALPRLFFRSIPYPHRGRAAGVGVDLRLQQILSP